MQDRNSPRVARLDELDNFEVADHDPDIRGWDVLSADGRKVGEVDDLFVDTAAMKVRYIGVELDKELRAGDRNRHILVPVGHARLHESDDNVLLSGLKADRVSAVPPYTGTLDREYETSLRTYFTDTGAAAATGAATAKNADFYDEENFDADRMYGSRRGTARRDEGEEHMTLSEEKLAVGKSSHKVGEVRVGKHVETEHVTREVPITREEVTIERRPLDASARAGAEPEIRGDEVRVPISEEEVVVDKRTVPKEELVVRKHEVQDTRTVEADLRHEEADVDRNRTASDPKERGR